MPPAEESNHTYDAHNDWMFESFTNIHHGKCDYTINRDSPTTDPSGTLAQYTTTVLYTAAFVAVLLMPRRREEQLEPGVAAPRLRAWDEALAPAAENPSKPRERWTELDLIRIVAVMCVVVEHSGGSDYSEHNFLFTAEWVLQYLFLVSGIAFQLSQASFAAYVKRYSVVFLFGATLNIIGDAAARPDVWYTDLGTTIYQMWYVVFILATAVLIWPLRFVMHGEDDPFGGAESVCGMPVRTFVAVLYNGLFLVAHVLYLCGVDLAGLLPQELRDESNESETWASYLVNVFEEGFYLCSKTLVVPALISLHIYLRRTPESAEVLAWVLFALVYVTIVVFPMQLAYAPQSIMLYMLGFYAAKHRHAGHARFKQAVHAYNMIVFITVVFVSMPELLGRCDRYPPYTVGERFRWYAVEGFLTLLLLTRSIQARDPCNIFTSLGWWALWAYCSHVMFARMLPTPWGAPTTYLTVIPFIVYFKGIVPMAGLEDRASDDASARAPDAAGSSGS